MPLSPLFKQAVVWGVGTQLGAHLFVGTTNLTKAAYRKIRKNDHSVKV